MADTIIHYGVFDAQGAPQSFWNTNIYPPQENGDRNAAIPAEAVEITYEEWMNFLTNPLARYGGKDAKPPVPTPLWTWGGMFVDTIGRGTTGDVV